MSLTLVDPQTVHGTHVSVTGPVYDLRLFPKGRWPQATFFIDTPTGLLLVSVPHFLGYRVIPWLTEGAEVTVSGKVRRDYDDGPMFIRARAMHALKD